MAASTVLTRPLRATAPARPAATGLRLTDRGIAAVLVAGLMIVVAAMTVIGATAASVTSDHHASQVVVGH